MAARNSSLKIRPLKSKEIPLLGELWTEAGLSFKPTGRDSLRNLRRQWLRDPDLFIGVFLGEKMIAAVIASDDGRKAWINRLAVVPEGRHKGIALELIDRCEAVLRKRGRHIFCVHIEDDNEESVRLFDKAGYNREECIHYYTKRDRNDY